MQRLRPQVLGRAAVAATSALRQTSSSTDRGSQRGPFMGIPGPRRQQQQEGRERPPAARRGGDDGEEADVDADSLESVASFPMPDGGRHAPLDHSRRHAPLPSSPSSSAHSHIRRHSGGDRRAEHTFTDGDDDGGRIGGGGRGLTATDDFDGPLSVARPGEDWRAFARSRPLPQVPWLQDTQRSYMDDAERLFGRKETWHAVRDPAARRRLLNVLREFVSETTRQCRPLRQMVRDRRVKLRRLRREYADRMVVAAFDENPVQALRRSWRVPKTAADLLRAEANREAGALKGLLSKAQAANTAHTTNTNTNTSSSSSSSSSSSPHDDDDTTHISRNNSSGTGAGASASNRSNSSSAPLFGSLSSHATELTEGAMPAAGGAYPFLRQRVLSDSDAVDPSLVDWTRSAFPDDAAGGSFAPPPPLPTQPPSVTDHSVAQMGGSGGFGKEQHEGLSPSSSGTTDSAATERWGGGHNNLDSNHPASRSSQPTSNKSESPNRSHKGRVFGDGSALRRPLGAMLDAHRGLFDGAGILYDSTDRRRGAGRAGTAGGAMGAPRDNKQRHQRPHKEGGDQMDDRSRHGSDDDHGDVPYHQRRSIPRDAQGVPLAQRPRTARLRHRRDVWRHIFSKDDSPLDGHSFREGGGHEQDTDRKGADRYDRHNDRDRRNEDRRPGRSGAEQDPSGYDLGHHRPSSGLKQRQQHGGHDGGMNSGVASDGAVKIDWQTAVTSAKHHGTSKVPQPQWHRANERLVRAARGEPRQQW